MRARYLSAFFLLLIPCSTVWAGPDEAAQSAVTVKSPKIVLDQERNEIHFVIDGKIIAVMDANGMRVRESIEYGGTLTDAGTAHFDKQLPGAGGVSDED